MEPEVFEQVGKALFGDNWLHQMARWAGECDEEVCRWFLGFDKIPAEIKADLLDDLKKQGNTILMLIRELED